MALTKGEIEGGWDRRIEPTTEEEPAKPVRKASAKKTAKKTTGRKAATAKKTTRAKNLRKK